MKKTTKEALDTAGALSAALRAAEQAGAVRDATEPMMWIQGEGTPRAELTLTRSTSGRLSAAEKMSEAELRAIASRLQRITGPRGEGIRLFIVGMYISFQDAQDTPIHDGDGSD